MKRRANPEEQLHRAVVAHLHARGKHGVVSARVKHGGVLLPEMAVSMKKIQEVAAISDVEYIFSRTVEVDGCWNWTGAKNARGYGRIRTGGFRKTEYVHRVVAFAFLGKKDGMCACHHCDNPSCVRPDHLFIGTAKENHGDMIAKGRGAPLPKADWPSSVRAGTHHLQKLKASDVYMIREDLALGKSHSSIAASHGVSPKTISKIATGVRWGHLV